ncbi:MAG TPA: LssY C-terminal domain-containing protein [Ktedonobacterales bacterium]
MPAWVTSVWQMVSSASPWLLAGIGMGIVLLVLALIFGIRVARAYRRLRRADEPGRTASKLIPEFPLPLTTVNRKGQQGDPVNFEVVASAAQLAAAFAAAGWYRADEIDLVTSARIVIDSVFSRKYSTAPVSSLYLYGHKEDLAFERPGLNVRERDHARFWQTKRKAGDGRPIWAGAATRDVKIELSKTSHLPTHGIGPDIDAERATVISDLSTTGFVEDADWRAGFGKETHGRNGGGDEYFTDGRVAVLVLANVWVAPLATQVRTPAAALLAKQAAKLVRWRLPAKGLERARAELARRRARRGAHPAAPTAPDTTDTPPASTGA